MYSDNSSQNVARKPITLPVLRKMKAESRPIVTITAYDASFAQRVDEARVDVVLVGDSLGMVIQGHASTVPVTVDDMVYHSSAVARGLHYALLIADMPFQAAAFPEQALQSATALMQQGGAQMVKLEGGGPMVDIVAVLTARDIPVCGHLGLTPQSVHKLGGYKVQGREQKAADALLADARALDQAGADMLVLECVPSSLAAEVAQAVSMPVIGIGAGAQVDGQVLVLHDLLGITPGRRPKFSKDFLTDQPGGVPEALARYTEAVRSRSFPAAEHGFER
jgi:3-methyl-2-oxobutanoate hydroxymethyltransferase